jgi:hypothetical protein
MANAAVCVGSNVGSAVVKVLPVKDIQLDRENPRIRKFLEAYGQNPTPEQFYLALGAAGDDESDSSTTFEKLKNSILSNGGIIQPIIVNRKPDGTLICVEGNTRVALYKNFLDEKRPGNWSVIPALVYEGMADLQVDSIRLQAHLVGIRPWDPYSKAKYLHYLHVEKQVPLTQLSELCGGRNKEISEFISAYSEMEKYYRPVVPEGSFDTSRFSGFVELQKPGIKEAVFQASHDLTDFAKWIHEQKLYPLNTIRLLPRILRHPQAREVFLRQGARKAAELLEKPSVDTALSQAAIGQLANALSTTVYNLTFAELEALKKEPGGEVVQSLTEAIDALNSLVKVIQES